MSTTKVQFDLDPPVVATASIYHENRDLLCEVLDRQIAPSRPVDEADYPTVQALMRYIEQIMGDVHVHYADVQRDLLGVLETRGHQYGEEVLAVMGEEGIAHFVKVKVWRLLGSIAEGNSERSREDSWIDVAGYAILAIAFRKWREEQRRAD